MKISTLIRRFFIPSIVKSIYFYLKFNCLVSPIAEIDLSPFLSIGAKSDIASYTKIKAIRGRVKIGKNVSIGEACRFSAGKDGIQIGDDCLIGPHVMIIGTNFSYDRLDIPMRLQGPISKSPIIIGSDVYIGAGACILDGAVIGSGAIITPNSVVTSKVQNNTIVQGNPATAIFIRR